MTQRFDYEESCLETCYTDTTRNERQRVLVGMPQMRTGFDGLQRTAYSLPKLRKEEKGTTAKQYLNRVRRIDKEIEALLRLVQRTRESLETVTQNYDSDGAQSTKNPHKYDRLVELESLVDAKIDEQISLKAEILNTIMQLEDRRQRLVLMEYYVEMKTWEQVAVDLNYAWRHVMRLHGMALKSMQEVLDESSVQHGLS